MSYRVLMIRAGGWEVWVETVAAYLHRRGFAVCGAVLQSHKAAWQTTAQYPLFVSKAEPGVSKLGAFIRSVRWLANLLRKQAYDAVYVVDSYTIPAVLAATRLMPFSRRMAFVYHTFEWQEPQIAGHIRIATERHWARRADLVVNVDQARGRLQQAYLGLAKPPLWVRNSLSKCYRVPAPEPLARRALIGETAGEDTIALFSPSAANRDRMGIELVRALCLLPPRYSLAMLEGDQEYVRLCRTEAAAKGAGDRLLFLPRMPFEEVMRYVVCAQIGVIGHADGGSLGNFFASPMRLWMFAAAGIPVVTGDVPTLASEVYRHGLGIVANVSNPNELANAIEELEARRHRDAELSNAIRRTFERDLAFEILGERLAGAIADAIQRRKRAPRATAEGSP